MSNYEMQILRTGQFYDEIINNPIDSGIDEG